MLDLTDARPDATRDRQLRTLMDTQLLKSCIYLLETAEAALARSYPRTRACLSDLLASAATGDVKLRGTAYALHSQLVKAMRDGSVNVVDGLLRYFEAFAIVNELPNVLPLWSPEFTAVESHALFSTIAADYESTYLRALDATRPSASEALAMKETIKSTLRRLAELDPETKGEVDTLISDFVIIRSNQTNAGSCFKAFGVVYLTVLKKEQEWTTYLESIVHEEAHHHLFALWSVNRIIESEGNRLYRSPIRTELRPMSGIFHAMFVLARTIRCLNIFRTHPLYGPEVNQLPTSYNQANNPAPLEEQFLDAYVTVRDNAKLTAFGKKLLESCKLMALGY